MGDSTGSEKHQCPDSRVQRQRREQSQSDVCWDAEHDVVGSVVKREVKAVVAEQLLELGEADPASACHNLPVSQGDVRARQHWDGHPEDEADEPGKDEQVSI